MVLPSYEKHSFTAAAGTTSKWLLPWLHLRLLLTLLLLSSLTHFHEAQAQAQQALDGLSILVKPSSQACTAAAQHPNRI